MRRCIHGLKSHGTNHGEHQERGAKGCGCGEGVPLPTRNFFKTFELNMVSFGAFLELILLQLNCLSYTHKSVSLDFNGIIARHLCVKKWGTFTYLPAPESLHFLQTSIVSSAKQACKVD